MKITTANNDQYIRILGVIILLFLISPAFSQIANIEGKRKSKREEGLSGSLDLSFSYVKNVDEILQYGANLNSYYFKNRHSLLLLLESAFIQAEGENLLNNNFEHLRYNYRLGENQRVILEVFEQLQQNRVQNIELRLLTGSGLRFIVFEKDSLQTNLGITGMYEYEQATQEGLTESHMRGSSYLSLDYWVSTNFNLNFIGYYQPLVTDFSDYRISSELGLKFNIIKRLAFKTKVSFIYDSEPLPDIPNSIINITNGLSISL